MKIESKKWKEGDFIQLGNGLRREMLAVVGKVVITSLSNDFASSGGAYLQSELERRGWKLMTEPALADKYPDGEMLLGRGSVKVCWCVTFSTGSVNAHGDLICRDERDKASSIVLWEVIRPFDRDLIGTVTS